MEPVETSPWWKSAVVYQIYPRSFADSNGDGIGDLPGILSRLDHLESLGVDVIWLSPIYRSPQADNGYDISDYQDIDPVFGTLDDFDRLLAAVHERGMKLLMDLVVNHTSDEHPWFVESRSSLDNPKRDWYWWRDPRSGHTAGAAQPNNWESFFSGPAWSLDQTTGQYYLHLFDRKQPDLNWENPEVRSAVYEMMRWWLDRGVDGFRMDVINLISKVTSLPDGIPKPGESLADHSASTISGPRIHEFMQEMHREVFAGNAGKYLTVGEMPGVTPEDAVRFTDPSRHELDMVFQFEHVSLDQGENKFDVLDRDVPALASTLAKWQTELGDRGWNSLYLNNHDQPRMVSRFGNDSEHWLHSAKALATMLHLHRGTPYIYQGEELGMTNVPFEGLSAFRDLESLNFFAAAVESGTHPDVLLAGLRVMSRDNARTPVQWDASPHAGFTTGIPWIDANPNHSWLNAEAQQDDKNSVLAFYRRVIALRHDNELVRTGDYAPLITDDDAVYAFTRSGATGELLVVVNLSDDEQEPEIDAAWFDEEVILSSYQDAAPEPSTFRPWEARVYSRRA